MTVVTSQLVDSVRENAQAIFKTAFNAAEAIAGANALVGRMTSQTDTEVYSWFGTTPLMSDVTGKELESDDLNSFEYSRQNLLYKAGIWVERAALADDKLGQLPPRFQQLGQEASRFATNAALAQLVDNPNAFDGTALFADTRVIGASGNVDNNLTSAAATGTTPTAAEMRAQISVINTTMLLFEDDKGRPQGLAPDTWVVSPAQLQPFLDATTTTANTALPVAGPGNAPMNGLFQSGPYRVYVYAALTAATMVALYTQDAVKPIFWQTRENPALEAITDPNSELAIVKDQFLFSARMRGRAGVGDPRHAVLHTWT